ncbi:GMC family oxidoreductase [Synechococcus sp. Cruz-9H2]|uniref:GMC oxidoreductase n=1 Tax=unclassified Synechococcus TaxID=2626047 RepID=UPI0020CBA5FB|nr:MULTISPECIES: GMC family oxidoreductase [unclassified Synechococcus]MCP9820359.1 GMC family oxidoreductase [Synechococcus sp. Cruz-9H2]MCP9844667.1 GMC family oxidoreductase [Synechococcus sp. Edmonson 11F2]MCP9856789.1 GMC family oxidoreductase [Synechococcus sp. Cruz-9C9]MCP9864001.1 GMC family oxidoreductase [Synechococcus sp. Cruz-7E5]MCP9871196.1 GMC family oxidoreductase [Synechococcus sp. Cruz-7B9]
MTSGHCYDVIVVGSGATGGWAAKQLTEQGLSVLLLEAGRILDPELDYPHRPPPERRILSRLGNIFNQPVQMRCGIYNGRNHRFFVNDRKNPYSTPFRRPFNWFRGQQVGGRLHLWSRLAFRLSDLELKPCSHDGYGVDWPLAYTDLEPYYNHVEAFLGLDGSAGGIPNLPDGLYSGEFVMTEPERSFRSAVENRFPDRQVVAARVVHHDVERVPKTLRTALGTGYLQIRTEAAVRRINTDPLTGNATGVTYIDRSDSTEHQVSSELVVLCASTIESVRILLNSACSRHPRGLGNSSGQLGLGLMDHPMIALAGPSSGASSRFENPADPYDSGYHTGFYIPRFRNQRASQGSFLRGYAVQGGIGRGPGWYLLAHGEMLARPENRITLHPYKTDAWGIPIVHIRCAYATNELAMIRDAFKALREMADAADLPIRMPPSGRWIDSLAYRLWKPLILDPSGAFVPGSAVHDHGGAAMGMDPASSVLNPYGQCWDAPNVVVADGAAFPSGCSQNITLTLMALVVRACDNLVKEYRRGHII